MMACYLLVLEGQTGKLEEGEITAGWGNKKEKQWQIQDSLLENTGEKQKCVGLKINSKNITVT